MTQATTWGVLEIETSPLASPTDVKVQDDEMLDALLSSHSGPTRPAYAVAGTPWLDTDTGQWFFYDGALDLPIAMFVGTVPATALAAGQPGQMFVITGFLYVCIAVDTWERAVLATF